MRARRAAACLALALLGAVALPARAQQGALTLDLGGGASVTRRMSINLRGGVYQTWTPTGFSFGEASAQLARQATWFARVRTGRIVAAVQAGPQTYAWRTMMGAAGIVYTDDLGAHWTPATFEATAVPSVIAFDPGSTFGVAVGDGHVWSSDDGGTRWRERRSDDARYVGVLVTGRSVVLRTADGNVLFARGSTFDLRTLATDPDADAAMDGDAVVVRAQGHVWRVLPTGELRAP